MYVMCVKGGESESEGGEIGGCGGGVGGDNQSPPLE